MDIEKKAKLLELKGLLNGLSHISFSYSRIEKEYPMHTLNGSNVDAVIRVYEKLVEDIKSLTMKNENSHNQNKNME